jgi:SAM-dependent methyltransferase
MSTYWITEEWRSLEYQEENKLNFKLLDAELEEGPTSILDIGCGLAWESRMFNEKYGTELWLLDGDVSANDNKPKSSSDVNYHTTTDDFLFYHPLSCLKEELDKKKTQNYTLVDTNNISIPEDKKFDLITSWLSCGFHYPASTYRDLILKHSHENTRIFFDIRLHLKTKEILNPEPGVEILKILSKHRKYINAEIRFI